MSDKYRFNDEYKMVCVFNKEQNQYVHHCTYLSCGIETSMSEEKKMKIFDSKIEVYKIAQLKNGKTERVSLVKAEDPKNAISKLLLMDEKFITQCTSSEANFMVNSINYRPKNNLETNNKKSKFLLCYKDF